MLHAVIASLVASLAAPADAPGSVVSTVFDMIMKGGWIMAPLGACSLVALTIAVERFIVTRRSRVAPANVVASIPALRRNPREAVSTLQGMPSPLSNVLIAAARSSGDPKEIVQKAITDAGERQMHSLRRRMRLLSALPQTATMLGLLGTVAGMIRTFTVVAASGESLGKTERLAQGIYEAWTATAAGLAIAIPTLLAFHMLMARIDAAAFALDAAAKDWLADPTEPAPVPEAAPIERLAPAAA